jgi:hypothetical protein
MRSISVPLVEIEPAIPAIRWLQTYVDSANTGYRPIHVYRGIIAD